MRRWNPVAVTDNQVPGAGSHGMYFYIGDAGSSMTAMVSANTVTGSAGYGILGYAYTNATGTFTFSGNTVSGSGDTGVRIRTYNSAMSNVTINDNVFTGNGTKTASGERYGLYLWTDVYAQSTFLVDGNRVGIESDDTTVNGNGTDGIYVYTYNQAVINGTVTGNTLTANARHGLYTYQQSNNGTSTLVLDGNTTYDNGSYGLYTNSYYANLNLTVSGNTVYGNTYGIYARSDSNSSNRLNALISGNDVHDNSQAGITCYANRQGQVYPEIRGNLVYDNTGAGIQCYRNASQSVTYTFVPVVTLKRGLRQWGTGGFAAGIGRCHRSVQQHSHQRRQRPGGAGRRGLVGSLQHHRQQRGQLRAGKRPGRCGRWAPQLLGCCADGGNGPWGQPQRYQRYI